ncbi:uncharacterized protein I303_108328 [Kwoniella dejecticola CBS 10117]|uniref:SH3 domain-containing protein n=1 Tax=Kwoniella dejecticola CBS 10117 TaxID=1296121 RepID=A0A1A5ZXQ6_9TREE|nr:uncharacterized protein I303_07345 [Kwoniella dejecticola CBS 10117]OBR82583.1 hypothetical protein I303_07345 [Kwoniella dejecticola CBS 10117]
MAAVASQPNQLHQQQQHYYAQNQYQPHQQMYPSQSVMEDVSDDEQHVNGHPNPHGDDSEDDDESIEGDIMDPAHAHFYHRQQQQALYYQQHQQQHGSTTDLTSTVPASSSKSNMNNGVGDGDEEMYSDEESDTDSMPDENIDFSLTYALHTFLATVEGQASVVKGDSLVLLDDANSYWWLVRVLKTEDVGYIPAENIETPYERLARLNKHRNVDLAAATILEKQAGTVQGREKLKDVIAGKAKGLRRDFSGEVNAENGNGGSRRVVFAPPTYVDHPGVTWSSDEDDSEEEDDGDTEVEQVEHDSAQQAGEPHQGDVRHETEVHRVDQSLGPDVEMEPDDGVEWADNATIEEQRRIVDQKQRQTPQQHAQNSNSVQPGSNKPFAPRENTSNGIPLSASNTSLASSSAGSAIMDPAQAGNETRCLTATPAVASGPGSSTNGPLLPSAMQAQQQNGAQRNVSGQSAQSVQSATSFVSTNSSQRSGTPTSPDEINKKGKKMKKGSKEDLDGGEKKKRGMLGGLFHRKGKDKGGKGVTGNDGRSSEESMVSGAIEGAGGQQRWSEERNAPPPTAAQQVQQQHQSQQPQEQSSQRQSTGVSSHGLRLQQQDQARMQSYTSKYLNRSPSSELHSPTTAEAAAAVAQSAAAMRLAASMGNGNLTNINGDVNYREKINNTGGRPSSIILSPNPAGPPLLNVIRIFAGDHIKSESSFKTALINETTSASDLIKQAMQRFHLTISSSSSSTDNGYFVTIRDVNGEEYELSPDQKPLVAFQEAVERWANESDEDLNNRIGAITPTVKRSSVSSLSSVMSLSNHPAIAKLGMNDFSDDSAVKIYLNRRRPGSVQLNQSGGMPEPASEFSSYSTQLSTVQEQDSTSSPENQSGEWRNNDKNRDSMTSTEGEKTPPAQAQHRFNNSLSIQTNGQASPERYSSPSARFTIQLIIHQSDLPDNLTFDPSSDSIVPRSLLKDRQALTGENEGPRKRYFVLPRNVNVIETIEQGLDRFGIQEGVVDGGDEVEDKIGKRRSVTRVRYNLAVIANGQERLLSTSGRILEVYDHPPNLRPMERSTPAERRRSRDLNHNQGSPSDILPTDPVFVLRKVQNHPRGLASAKIDSTPRQSTISSNGNADTRSPAEIIAAQRAASRANQKALISAHTNTTQGVDIVLPDQRGTFRSSRLIENDGEEVVRYSYIDGDGETYDISELLEEEWGNDPASSSSPDKSLVKVKPALNRLTTDQSAYITAPSTPEEGAEKAEILSDALALNQAQTEKRRSRSSSQSQDILVGAVQETVGKGQQQETVLEEKLKRVIDRVKSGSAKGSTSSEEVIAQQQQQDVVNSNGRQTPNGRTTPNNGRQTPQHQQTLSSLPEGKVDSNSTPKASNQVFNFHNNVNDASTPRSNSRSGQYNNTAQSINKIIYSRHRQQPSIASIMSDLEGNTSNTSTSQSQRRHSSSRSSLNRRHSNENGQEEEDDAFGDGDGEEDRSSTPVTATSSTHPTPPFHGAVFTRAVSGSVSPTPRGGPVRYKDDFGIKDMMAIIEIRSREYMPSINRRNSSNSNSSSTSGSRSNVTSKSKSKSKTKSEQELEELDKILLGGERLDWDKENIHPEIKSCFTKTMENLKKFDEDLDSLLAEVANL